MSETGKIKKRWREIRSLLFQHRDVLDNAAFLTVGPIASAVFGFAFWWIAARNYSPEQVGVATAVISAMNIVMFAASMSLTTTMMGLPLNKMPEAPGLVSSAAIFRIGLVTLVSLAAIAAGAIFDLQIYSKLDAPGIWLVLYVGVVIMILGDHIDGILTGFGKSALRMVRELAQPAFRVALLVLFVLVVGAGSSFESLIGVTLAGEVASIGLILVWALRQGFTFSRPDFKRLWEFIPTTAAHHVLNVTAIGANIVMPLLVAEMLSAEFAAVFYPAWMMMQVALMAPAGVCMAIYALGSGAPAHASERIGLSLVISLLWSTATALVLMAGLNSVLSLLNPLYPEIAGPALKFIGLGAIPLVIKHHYIAVMRMEGRMMSATPILAAGCATEIGGAALGAYLGGSIGFMVGWLTGVTVFALLMLPAVLSATVYANDPPTEASPTL